MKIKLIDDWKKCLHFLSVQGNLICISLTSAYGLMYDHLKDTIPPTMMTKIVIGMFVVNTLLRLIQQEIGSNDETK